MQVICNRVSVCPPQVCCGEGTYLLMAAYMDPGHRWCVGVHNGLSLHFSLVGSGDVTQAFRSLGGCEHRISLYPCLHDRAGDMCAQVWVHV